jgi:putative FmdB family regulatory protein
MPTYEYACQSCGTHVEVFQHFNEEPLTVCGICAGPLRKVFHPAGILFKGSGFYATDSRASRSKSSRDGSSEGPSAGEKAGTGEKAGSREKSGRREKTGNGGDSGEPKSEPPAKKEPGPAASGAKEKSA